MSKKCSGASSRSNIKTVPSRESLYKFWVKVEGLTYTELRHVSERLGEQAERMRNVVMECLFSLMMDVTMFSERETVAEFSVPTWCLLNSLEGIGYRVTSNLTKCVVPLPLLRKVVTSDQLVSGIGTFDMKEFVWTLHKSKEDWESSS